MRKESVSTVVFRFDGTLLDIDLLETSRNMAMHMDISVANAETFVCSLAGVIAEFPIIVGPKKVTSIMLAETLDSLMHNVLNSSDITSQQVIEALQTSDHYVCSVSPKVLDTIMYLYQKGYKLVSTGNTFTTVQMELLRRYGMLKYFDGVFGPLGNYYSSYPTSFKSILKGSDPEHFMFVSHCLGTDINTAHSMGMKTTLLSKGAKGSGSVVFTCTPDHIIENFNDLDVIL